MTKPDAMKILALMQGNWAHVQLNEVTVTVWCDHLRDIPAEAGMEVAYAIIRDERHFPTVSEFRERWRGHLRKERDWQRPPALEAPIASPELGKAGVALARVALQDAGDMKVILPPEVEERRNKKPLSHDPDWSCHLDDHRECGPKMWDPIRGGTPSDQGFDKPAHLRKKTPKTPKHKGR